MNYFSYAININNKRFQNLLEISVDETERRTIQRLLTEEKAKAAFMPRGWIFWGWVLLVIACFVLLYLASDYWPRDLTLKKQYVSAA